MIQKPCDTPDREHVRQLLVRLKTALNEKQYYPPRSEYRSLVALVLYSKCITVAEATLVLLDASFTDEAFGLTRTMVDVFFTLRYITNKETEERAKLFYQFFSKDAEQWIEVIADYWPKNSQTLDPKMRRLAARYKSPHKWSGKTIKEMALEPDTLETDPQTGKPTDFMFHYRAIFRWTSHYVHPTIPALQNHFVHPGNDPFVVRGGGRTDMSFLTAFNVASYLLNTMVMFYRCIGDEQPGHLGCYGQAILRHLGQKHKRKITL